MVAFAAFLLFPEALAPVVGSLWFLGAASVAGGVWFIRDGFRDLAKGSYRTTGSGEGRFVKVSKEDKPVRFYLHVYGMITFGLIWGLGGLFVLCAFFLMDSSPEAN